MNSDTQIIVITGPTATGKTRLAVSLAREFNGEIISADSRQVYRGLDLGTGKDIDEYGSIPHHLIDVAAPEELYDLSRFITEATQAITQIYQRGKLPIICGGTALYINALLQGYELPGTAPNSQLRNALEAMSPEALADKLQHDYPASYAALNKDDQVNFLRLRRAYEKAVNPMASKNPAACLNALVLGVLYPRNEVRQRIEARLDERLKQGMIEEVAGLLNNLGLKRLEMLGLEYREIGRFVAGLCSFEEMRSTLLNRIRQFAKHQDGFFRKMEKEGIKIHWIERGNESTAHVLTKSFLAGDKQPEITFRLADFINPDPYSRRYQK